MNLLHCIALKPLWNVATSESCTRNMIQASNTCSACRIHSGWFHNHFNINNKVSWIIRAWWRFGAALFALFHVIINRLMTDIGLLMMRCASHIHVHRWSNIDIMAIRSVRSANFALCEIIIHNILLMNICTLNFVLSVLVVHRKTLGFFLWLFLARRNVLILIVLGSV